MAKENLIKNQLPVSFTVDKSFLSDKFIKLYLKICHDGKNPNRSRFNIKDLKNKKETLSNSPILAHITTDSDNKPCFGSHDMTLESNAFNDEELKLIYLEQPVGVIPETNNFRVVEEDGKNYIYADAYIWRGYSNYCEEILAESPFTKISMEVNILAYSYDSKEDCYDITDFEYAAVTLLNNDLETGMVGAKATIQSFSMQESLDIESLSLKLKDEFNIINQKFAKGVANLDKKMASDILAQFAVTDIEIGINLEDVSEYTEESFTAKIQEYLDNKQKDIDEDEKDEDKKDEELDEEDNLDDIEKSKKSEKTLDEKKKSKCSLDENGVFNISFELSFDDIRGQLYSLLRDKYDDNSYDTFICEVFESYFIFGKYFENKYLKQSYIVEDEKVVFKDDAIEVFSMFLTQEEKDALEKTKEAQNSMVESFESLNAELEQLKEFKLKTESNAKKEQVEALFINFDNDLNSIEEYSVLKKSFENLEDYSKCDIDSISNECYVILGKKNFTKQKKTDVYNSYVKKQITTQRSEEEPYGGLFSKFSNN